MRSEAEKIAALSFRRLVKQFAHSGIPHGLLRATFLREDPYVGLGADLQRPRAKLLGQIANAKDAAALLSLWPTDFLVPDALLDLDGCCIHVHMPPLKAEYF